MSFPFDETLTLHSYTGSGRDGDGSTVPTFTDTTITGCGFDPGGSIERVQGQDLVETQPTAYLPAGTVVGPVDQVTARGVRYEVDGSPNDWHKPGWDPGVVVKLKAVTG